MSNYHELVERDVVEAAMRNWETILEELEAMSMEYESDGWETITIHPGEIQLLSGETTKQTGLDILIPDDEYREIESVLESGVSFNSYEIHKEIFEQIVHFIVVMEHTDSKTALLYPAFYGLQEADVIDQACQAGQFRTFLRRLNGEFVELTYEEPALFAPPEGWREDFCPVDS